MKRLLWILCFLSCWKGIGWAQECELPLSILLPQQTEALGEVAHSQVVNKLRHMAAMNGIGGLAGASPFALTASFDIVEQTVVSSVPAKYFYTFTVNLFILGTHDRQVYASTSVDQRGLGSSQTQAYVSAIRKLQPTDPQIQAFLQNGKQKILSYYDKQYLQLIRKAQLLASQRDYEQALFLLMAVPECCVGFAEVSKAAAVIFQQFVDQKCVENLAQAQAAWMSGFTSENATVASVFLSEIYPSAACYGDAVALVNEIKKHMGERWKFELKRWDDRMSIEKQRMQFMRDISMAYAENQPRETIDLIFR